ncbi:UNVERIFIED_CONTAM: hypothetical protein Sradi_4544600 [Sesamum radiatum]|uniref:Uncharacterized protein n=1 Tax=Sesamum radiatum TaxID=300843 RepID=A0AAW2NAV9_SESRA
MPLNAKKFSFEAYEGWWVETHDGFLEENAARLLGTSPIKAPPKDKECGKRVVQDLPYEHVAFVPPNVILKLSRLLRQVRRRVFLVHWMRMRVVTLTVIGRGQRRIRISQRQRMLMVMPQVMRHQC